MFPFFTEISYIAAGWFLKEQIGAPKGGQPAPPQGGNPWQNMPPQQMGPQGYYPGAPVAPPQMRAPQGPVALDANLPPELERDVWKCLSEADEPRAAAFAARLAQYGFSVAAGVVSYHAHMLGQVRAMQARMAQAQGVSVPVQPEPAPQAPFPSGPAAPQGPPFAAPQGSPAAQAVSRRGISPQEAAELAEVARTRGAAEAARIVRERNGTHVNEAGELVNSAGETVPLT